MPGFVIVAAEGDVPVEDQLVGLEVDDLGLAELDERAHLLDAAIEQQPRAGLRAAFDQLGRIGRARPSTAVWRALQHHDPIGAALVQLVAHQLRQDRASRAACAALLVHTLAGRVGIVEVGNRQRDRLGRAYGPRRA